MHLASMKQRLVSLDMSSFLEGIRGLSLAAILLGTLLNVLEAGK